MTIKPLAAVAIAVLLALPAFSQEAPTDTPVPPRIAAPQPPAPPVLPVAQQAEATPVPEAQVTETQIDEARVFGQWLFQGKFAQESFRGFNPDYIVSIGDVIDLKLWGAFDLQVRLEVDAQGNIFVPQVGPIAVANTRNAALNDVVRRSIKRIYREDVDVYASLAASQPVKVFVSGAVHRPGLYAASASDSLLHFLDRAGGIEPLAGSYLDVRVLRGGEPIKVLSLYDFLLEGKLPLLQFQDGDTIFVGPLRSTVQVRGLTAIQAQYEFDREMNLSRLLQMAGVSERATHVRITRNQGATREAQYLALGEATSGYTVQGGDEIDVVADRLVGNILVAVEGEHQGSGQFVLPYKATLKDLIEQIHFAESSRKDSVQLFRQSVAQRQKQMLSEMLDKLEQAALSARSATRNEAAVRTDDSRLLLQFIERARKIEPRGQVVLPTDVDPATIALEDGDVIRIPRRSNLVMVHGEVFLPNGFVYRDGLAAEGYVERAGGLMQTANKDRILVMRPSGEVERVKWESLFHRPQIAPGDEILVLPQVDKKRFQLTKDMIEVIYQTAIAAGVVLAI